jgi:hypothetical protein
MCLYTKQWESKIAEEDITCYKALTKDLKSPCFGQQYKLDKLIKSKLVRNPDDYIALNDTIINEGLHTYKDKCDAIDTVHFRWFCVNNWTNEVHEVYAPVVVECIIPKGSEYYIGEDRERCKQYASNQLITKKIIYDATENAKN